MVAMLPTDVHIVETRLAIMAPSPDVRRVTNRRNPLAILPRELWGGAFLLAPMSLPVHVALKAFLWGLDGKVVPFGVTLRSGYLSQPATLSGVLASAAAVGAQQIVVNVSAGTVIQAGTLLSVGNVDTAGYQICEVLDDAFLSAATVLNVAPRIRSPLAAGAAVVLGTVVGKYTLASDNLDNMDAMLDRGACTLPVIEALL